MSISPSPLLTRRAFLRAGALASAALLCPLPASAHPLPCTRTRLLMGTLVGISVAPGSDPSSERLEAAIDAAFARMASLESILSRHDSASPLAELNRAGRLADAPPALCAVIDRAKRCHSLTSGAFDATVAPVLNVLRRAQNPRGRMELDPKALREAVCLVGDGALTRNGSTLTLERTGMSVTLDGIAKGYIVDAASRCLHEAGMHNHLINAGGDIMAQGCKAPGSPWMVGIEAPDPHGRATPPLLTLPLSAAIATSGRAHMYFDASREHHHIINPLTGASPARVHSVSVTARSALEADALATALSVMAPHDALHLARSLPGVECAIILADGNLLTSPGLRA